MIFFLNHSAFWTAQNWLDCTVRICPVPGFMYVAAEIDSVVCIYRRQECYIFRTKCTVACMNVDSLRGNTWVTNMSHSSEVV